ncbi:MAG: DUF1232 domain-containing protein [Bacteroidaceae bacterium]|nr:DUF1232 domain-containing protein [Bacteroidaceae bacterium]
MSKAHLYTSNPKKLKQLLPLLSMYISKKGLSKVKDKLVLMGNYLTDITKGKYKDYDGKKLLVIVGAIIYVVTPFDLLPDLIPPGLIDDLSIVAWALKEASDELERYKAWKYPEKEDVNS